MNTFLDDPSAHYCQGPITIPTNLPDGPATLQYIHFGGGPFLGEHVSCADIMIRGGPQENRADPPVFKGGDTQNPEDKAKCTYYNTNMLGKCVFEPCRDEDGFSGNGRSKSMPMLCLLQYLLLLLEQQGAPIMTSQHTIKRVRRAEGLDAGATAKAAIDDFGSIYNTPVFFAIGCIWPFAVMFFFLITPLYVPDSGVSILLFQKDNSGVNCSLGCNKDDRSVWTAKQPTERAQEG
jgi:hypothetical protein